MDKIVAYCRRDVAITRDLFLGKKGTCCFKTRPESSSACLWFGEAATPLRRYAVAPLRRYAIDSVRNVRD